jgi:hypothetical protein
MDARVKSRFGVGLLSGHGGALGLCGRRDDNDDSPL